MHSGIDDMMTGAGLRFDPVVHHADHRGYLKHMHPSAQYPDRWYLTRTIHHPSLAYHDRPTTSGRDYLPCTSLSLSLSLAKYNVITNLCQLEDKLLAFD